MNIQELTREEWNDAVIRNAPVFGAFLQSYEWGEFQRSLGREIRRVYVKKGQKELLALAVRMKLPFGKSYWMIPKGPIGAFSGAEMVAELRNALPGAMFLRMEPSKETRLREITDVQPSNTIIVDLEQGEESLLANMKSKTRYNIRLAMKKGVESRFVNIEDHEEDFARLMEQTGVRDGITHFPMSYYVKQLKELAPMFRLAMAFYEGRPIAVNVICDFAGMRTYVHGATSNLHRNVMAQYHLHYFLMIDAMKEGLLEFDFWGVAPEGEPNASAWAGITRYKLGYGGALASVPGTVDLPIEHVWYALYTAVKRLKR